MITASVMKGLKLLKANICCHFSVKYHSVWLNDYLLRTWHKTEKLNIVHSQPLQDAKVGYTFWLRNFENLSKELRIFNLYSFEIEWGRPAFIGRSGVSGYLYPKEIWIIEKNHFSFILWKDLIPSVCMRQFLLLKVHVVKYFLLNNQNLAISNLGIKLLAPILLHFFHHSDLISKKLLKYQTLPVVNVLLKFFFIILHV